MLFGFSDIHNFKFNDLEKGIYYKVMENGGSMPWLINKFLGIWSQTRSESMFEDLGWSGKERRISSHSNLDDLPNEELMVLTRVSLMDT